MFLIAYEQRSTWFGRKIVRVVIPFNLHNLEIDTPVRLEIRDKEYPFFTL